MLKVDGVFAGGGIKAFSFVGVMRALSQRNIEFERLAGTSAGSIVASLIKAGYTSEEISHIFDQLDLKELLDTTNDQWIFRFYRWIRLYRSLGIYKGNNLVEWMDHLLKQKGISTFGDLPPGSLKMVASDVTNGEILVIPDDLPKYGIIPETFPVAQGIRMSCGLPFFFEPYRLIDNKGKESLIVDGGVLSNFPMWLFMKEAKTKLTRPVLGFRLTPPANKIQAREANNAFTLLQAMFDTMRNAHDQRYISKTHAKNIVFIPVNDISTTQFSISEKDKNELMEIGEKSTLKFLKNWTY
ncbi:patatin-like phospholipase family protein [Evansella sp. AB-P1]|uniref:patatin-like phospholipase family protein n=1 Tax=Evansella sp. AB-P1 TaxID=3037653 RepID=UPI00241CF59B|nr:patatin-like phospholipase family protein [Evansella sp. AB-P1]MDG5788709.1 patatin-like phospholipase family protein [Evansella sp. AB-P1]